MKLALYQPDMAPNVGAVLRICACFGVPLDIIEPCGFPLSSRDVRRVAMDYESRAETRRHASWEAFREARAADRLVLLTTRADLPVWDFGFRPADVLLMGRESAGVPDEVHAACAERVAIPMPGGGRSLNIAVAAAIALFEAMRQTGACEARGESPT